MTVYDRIFFCCVFVQMWIFICHQKLTHSCHVTLIVCISEVIILINCLPGLVLFVRLSKSGWIGKQQQLNQSGYFALCLQQFWQPGKSVFVFASQSQSSSIGNTCTQVSLSQPTKVAVRNMQTCKDLSKWHQEEVAPSNENLRNTSD